MAWPYAISGHFHCNMACLQAWSHASEVFGLTMNKELLVELAGKPVDELFSIICDRSGKKV